jgi:hypothetical protein
MLLTAAPGSAQDAASDASRDASARALFQEGVQLVERSDWENAEDRFRRALALRSSPVIAYNLATVLVTRGKLVEASELLRKIALEPGLDGKLRQSVSTLQADVIPQLARVRVRVELGQTGDVVRIDTTRLHEAQLGVDIPFDPGPHRISLERSGQILDEQTIELSAAETTDVTLRVSAIVPAPAEVAAAATPRRDAAPAAATRADSDSALAGQWWFWTGIGVAATAVVVAVVVASSSSDSAPAAAFQGDFAPRSIPVEVER